MKHLRALNKYFWKYRIRFGVGILFVILSNYFNVLSPQVTGFVVDFVQRSLEMPGYRPPAVKPNYDPLVEKVTSAIEVNTGDWLQVVLFCGLTILFLALLRGFFLFLMRQTIIVMSRHIEYDQKNEIYRHYQHLDAPFYKSHNTGDLMNRISEDVSRVRMFTGPAVMYLANLVAVIALSVFFMLKRDPALTLYVLAPLPVLAITIYLVNNTINRKSERIQESLSDLTTHAQETYSGIRVVKSFVQEKAMLGFFSANSETYRRNAISLARVEAIYFPSITLLIGISTLLTIMIGGLYYIYGTHNVGLDTIVEFVMYINMLTFPVSAIGLTASMIQRAAASQKRINQFLRINPGIHDGPASREIDIEGVIAFEGVSFTYPHTGIQALRNFNLRIRKGEKVAIVGRTGSGKSTLAQLLLRFYDPDEGRICMDGLDLKEIRLSSLRSQVSYVPQDVFLFSDSVAANIAFGEHLPGEDVRRAARLSGVIDEIEKFPAGFDTLIGERGVTLSGGQKQRISIARALAGSPRVLLFDDCLSAVDARTENEIMRNLQTVLAGTTTLLISHRLFNLYQFDRIIVLDQGQIIEEGHHDALMQKQGFYHSLYQEQLKDI